jgi:hypothetical protein
MSQVMIGGVEFAHSCTPMELENVLNALIDSCRGASYCQRSGLAPEIVEAAKLGNDGHPAIEGRLG